MDRLELLAPGLVVFSIMVTAFVVWAGLHAIGRRPKVAGVKHNQLLGAFWAGYIYWLLGPVERAMVGRISPNAITFVSLLLCIGSGVAAAEAHLATACWLYVGAGLLDMLDGRLARATGQQTKAGALFDSVADRWGELAVFTGFAFYLRDSSWLFAVMLALAGSMMVSYTRARGEGLGLELRGGLMQRAERIVIICAGAFVGAWLGAVPETAHHAPASIGWAMLVCGVFSTATGIGRWIEGMRLLVAADRQAAMPPPDVDPRRGTADLTPSPGPGSAAVEVVAQRAS